MYAFSFCSFLEKSVDEPSAVIVKPAVVANVNKWEGEDEDDVKVSYDVHALDFYFFLRSYTQALVIGYVFYILCEIFSLFNCALFDRK